MLKIDAEFKGVGIIVIIISLVVMLKFKFEGAALFGIGATLTCLSLAYFDQGKLYNIPKNTIPVRYR